MIELDSLTYAAQQACANVGIESRDVHRDGKWYRTKVDGKFHSDAGRIKFFQDGTGGIVWNHITGQHQFFWVKPDRMLNPEERQDQKRRMNEESKRFEREQQEQYEQAAKVAELVIANCSLATDVKYLATKGYLPTATMYQADVATITKLIGYHPQAKGKKLAGLILVLPVYQPDGEISTIEMIDGVGLKAALAGGKKGGGFWVAMELPKGDGAGATILIGEGCATVMASIEARPGSYGVAALCCGNLKSVATSMRRFYPQAKIIVLADIGNGQSEAVEAARTSRAHCVIPEIPSGVSPEGITDFDDIRRVCGTAEVTRQLKEPELEDTGHRDYTELFPEVPFPWQALPEAFTDLCQSFSKALQVAPEMIAGIALTIVSGVIGNSVRVSPKKGWYAPLFLWLTLIAESGYGKTHPLEVLGACLKLKQHNAFKAFDAAMNEHRRELAEYKNSPPHQRGPLPEPPPPMKHYYSENFTFETLIEFFKVDSRGILFLVDEIGKLLTGMDQYKNGKGSDRQNMLELFNCGALKVDRKSGSLYCANSGAAIVGGIQPSVLSAIFTSAGFEDGMTTRFISLHMKPEAITFSTDELDDCLIEQWEGLLEYCSAIPMPHNEKPSIINFADTALPTWVELHDRLHRVKLLLPTMARVYVTKWITYSLKFCGILHVLQLAYAGGRFDEAAARQIDRRTAQGAVDMTMFFAGQAMKTLKLYGDSAAEAQDGRIARLTAVISELLPSVRNSRLAVAVIRNTYNEGLPDAFHLPEHGKALSALLVKLGVRTVKGTSGERFAVINESNLQNFSKPKTSKTTNAENAAAGDSSFSGFSGFSSQGNSENNGSVNAQGGFSGFSGFIATPDSKTDRPEPSSWESLGETSSDDIPDFGDLEGVIL